MSAAHPPFDGEKMQKVLDYHKVKVPWAKLEATYAGWSDVYKQERLQAWGLPEIRELSQVFEFTGATLTACRNQLINWLSKNKMFYNDDFHVVVQRIRDELARFNDVQIRLGNKCFPYINWLPQYGGMLQLPRRSAELSWRQRNQVPFHLITQEPPTE